MHVRTRGAALHARVAILVGHAAVVLVEATPTAVPAVASLGVVAAVTASRAAAQDPMEHMTMQAHADHMLRVPLGGDWVLTGMAQAFPVVTFGDVGGADGASLRRTEAYLTQPVAMLGVQGAGGLVHLRTTLDLEGVTQPDGELTPGGWGEGFLDRRHPHTLLHEMMLSFDARGTRVGSLSLSLGKGFAPYGTDDPMTRPGLKYPTNHHLSQVLERWAVNGAWSAGGWSVEAGIFGGAEPTGPYDLSNVESFGDSWSTRTTRRWGADATGAWELSASFGSVAEDHDGVVERTRLWNAAVRRDGAIEGMRLYALIEVSKSDPEDREGYRSVLAETMLTAGRHRPYARLEVATRPEYPREGSPGEDAFFRYDHDDHPIAASDWLIVTAGYGFEATGAPWSVRPFVEVQRERADTERGPFDPVAAFGARSFWSVSAGARIFLGGAPMRMGSYGVLDPSTAMASPYE